MKALVVVIMGGVGNMLGSLAAGLLLGVAEALCSYYVDSGLTLAVAYALFLIVLVAGRADCSERPDMTGSRDKALSPQTRRDRNRSARRACRRRSRHTVAGLGLRAVVHGQSDQLSRADGSLGVIFGNNAAGLARHRLHFSASACIRSRC